MTPELLKLLAALIELVGVCGLAGYIIAFEVFERRRPSRGPTLTTTQVRQMLAPGINDVFGKEP